MSGRHPSLMDVCYRTYGLYISVCLGLQQQWKWSYTSHTYTCTAAALCIGLMQITYVHLGVYSTVTWRCIDTCIGYRLCEQHFQMLPVSAVC